MIKRIINVARVFVKEADMEVVALVLGVLVSSHEFAEVAAVLVGIHNARVRRRGFESAVNAGVDSCCHAGSAAGCYYHYAV